MPATHPKTFLLRALCLLAATCITYAARAAYASDDREARAGWRTACSGPDINVFLFLESERLRLEISETPFAASPPQPYRITALDIDGDGRDEVLSASEHGELIVSDAENRFTPRPFSSAALPPCLQSCRLFVEQGAGEETARLIIHYEDTHAVFLAERTATGWSAPRSVGTTEERIVGILDREGQTTRLLTGKDADLNVYRVEDSLSFDSNFPLQLPIAESPIMIARSGASAALSVLWSVGPDSLYSGWYSYSVNRLQPPVRRLAEFQPIAFDWYSVFAAADLNGDGIAELIVQAPESKHLWAAIHINGFTVEAPIESNVFPDSPWTTLVPGDFNGDGLGDLLLHQGETSKWLLGISAASSPVANQDLVVGGKSVRIGTHGHGCLTGEPESLQVSLPPELDAYAPATVTRADGARINILLRRRAPVPGARFAIGHQPAPPYVCNGYRPSVEVWNDRQLFVKWGKLELGKCPPGYAFYFTDDPARAYSGRTILPNVACCPLPGEDILLQEVGVTTEACPDNSVVIGVYPTESSPFEPSRLTCAVINLSKYTLGPITRGRYWGLGFSARWARDHIPSSRLPAAIRHGAGRERFNAFNFDGCVGTPVGSLLVGQSREGSGCERFLFRELRYRKSNQREKNGAPVEMFPVCSLVEDISTPFARCGG